MFHLFRDITARGQRLGDMSLRATGSWQRADTGIQNVDKKQAAMDSALADVEQIASKQPAQGSLAKQIMNMDGTRLTKDFTQIAANDEQKQILNEAKTLLLSSDPASRRQGLEMVRGVYEQRAEALANEMYDLMAQQAELGIGVTKEHGQVSDMATAMKQGGNWGEIRGAVRELIAKAGFSDDNHPGLREQLLAAVESGHEDPEALVQALYKAGDEKLDPEAHAALQSIMQMKPAAVFGGFFSDSLADLEKKMVALYNKAARVDEYGIQSA